MKLLLTILILGFLLSLQILAAAQNSLFSTQFNLSIGATRVLANDKPQTGFSTSVKELYLLSGAVYVDAGFCTSIFNSIKFINDSLTDRHNATFLSVPAGIGFFMGDDRTYLITGIDFISGVYVDADVPETDKRRLVWGYMPEFGFSIKVGRSKKRGFGLGMVGKLMVLQSPSQKAGQTPQINFAGVGVVVRF